MIRQERTVLPTSATEPLLFRWRTREISAGSRQSAFGHDSEENTLATAIADHYQHLDPKSQTRLACCITEPNARRA